MRALVVDDSRTVRLIVGKILREVGMEVIEAANGLEALAQLERSPDVDLMLLDWNMPEMNGLELLSSVRRDNRLATTKIMMVTTETALTEITRALEAGADEYIMKPFTLDAVDDKLRILGW